MEAPARRNWMPVTHGGVVMAVGVGGGGGGCVWRKGGARAAQCNGPPGSHRHLCDRSRWAVAQTVTPVHAVLWVLVLLKSSQSCQKQAVCYSRFI